MSYLVSKNADVNQMDFVGLTPLDTAALRGMEALEAFAGSANKALGDEALAPGREADAGLEACWHR